MQKETKAMTYILLLFIVLFVHLKAMMKPNVQIKANNDGLGLDYLNSQVEIKHLRQRIEDMRDKKLFTEQFKVCCKCYFSLFSQFI